MAIKNFELHITLLNGNVLHFSFACHKLESAQNVARSVLNDNGVEDMKLACVNRESHAYGSMEKTIDAANEMIAFWSKAISHERCVTFTDLESATVTSFSKMMLVTGDPEYDLQTARKICSFESFDAYDQNGNWITSTEL